MHLPYQSLCPGSSPLSLFLARALSPWQFRVMEPSPAKNRESSKVLLLFFIFLSQARPGQGVPTYPDQNQTLPPLPPSQSASFTSDIGESACLEVHK